MMTDKSLASSSSPRNRRRKPDSVQHSKRKGADSSTRFPLSNLGHHTLKTGWQLQSHRDSKLRRKSGDSVAQMEKGFASERDARWLAHSSNPMPRPRQSHGRPSKEGIKGRLESDPCEENRPLARRLERAWRHSIFQQIEGPSQISCPSKSPVHGNVYWVYVYGIEVPGEARLRRVRDQRSKTPRLL